MTFGARLAMAVVMLGASLFASSADAPVAAPDAVAARVEALLHARYADREKLAVIDRVFTIEKRLGAYRAARTKAQLVYRINADLWVATKDRRVSVHGSSEPSAAGIARCDLGSGLQLFVPVAGSATENALLPER